MSRGGFDFFPSVSWLSLTLGSEMCFQFARNGNWAEWNVLPSQKNTSAAGLQVDVRVIYCAMSACTSVCLCVYVCLCNNTRGQCCSLWQQSSGVFKSISCASAELKSASLDFRQSLKTVEITLHSIKTSTVMVPILYIFFSGNTSWFQPSCYYQLGWQS